MFRSASCRSRHEASAQAMSNRCRVTSFGLRARIASEAVTFFRISPRTHFKYEEALTASLKLDG